jgi:hypothetical protein
MKKLNALIFAVLGITLGTVTAASLAAEQAAALECSIIYNANGDDEFRGESFEVSKDRSSGKIAGTAITYSVYPSFFGTSTVGINLLDEKDGYAAMGSGSRDAAGVSLGLASAAKPFGEKDGKEISNVLLICK